MKKQIIFSLLASFFLAATAFAVDKIGVVNFSKCITDSKQGKQEQQNLEKMKEQWTKVIQDTEKELKALDEKFKDHDYMDGLSPEAEQEMKNKQAALQEDFVKYQNQLYQSLNQANYFIIQKIYHTLGQAAEAVAKDKKLDLVLNSEARFYHNPSMDVTDPIIQEMDKIYVKEEEQAKKNAKEPAKEHKETPAKKK